MTPMRSMGIAAVIIALTGCATALKQAETEYRLQQAFVEQYTQRVQATKSQIDQLIAQLKVGLNDQHQREFEGLMQHSTRESWKALMDSLSPEERERFNATIDALVDASKEWIHASDELQRARDLLDLKRSALQTELALSQDRLMRLQMFQGVLAHEQQRQMLQRMQRPVTCSTVGGITTCQ